VTRNGARFRLKFFHPKSQVQDSFEDEPKNNKQHSIEKKMDGRKSQNVKKSKYSKNRKGLFCAFLQDSSKTPEDKCVYTRLDVFTWISIVSIPQGIIKNLQSG